MSVLVCELVVLYLIIGKVLETSGEVRPIVFSYSAEKLLHPAVISHHYKPPATTDVTLTTTPVSEKDNTTSIQRREHTVPPLDVPTSATESYYCDGASGFGHRCRSPTTEVTYENYNDDYYSSKVRPQYAQPQTSLNYYDEDISYDSKPSPVPIAYDDDGSEYGAHPVDADYHYDFSNEPNQRPSEYLPPPTNQVAPMIGINDPISSPHFPTGLKSSSVPGVLEHPTTNHLIPHSPPVSHHSHYDYTAVPEGGSSYNTASKNHDVYNDFITVTPPVRFPYSAEKLPPPQDHPPSHQKPLSEFSTGGSQSSPDKGNPESPLNVPIEDDKIAHSVHFTNNKILQQPLKFAYSSHLTGDGGVTNGNIVNASFPEYDEHLIGDGDVKKKEQYALGGEQEHHSAMKLSDGNKGKKGYTSSHEHDEKNKGYRIKESDKGNYSDEKGKKRHKEEGGGHYGEHHSGNKGQKAAKFGESGEHRKGHSTKGEHNIHKKDEYLKKIVFYDEHHEGGDHQKHGGYASSSARKKGGKKRKGHHKSSGHKNQKGKDGKFEEISKLSRYRGHKDAKSHDGRYQNHEKYSKKGSDQNEKMWKYISNHPDWDSITTESEQ